MIRCPRCGHYDHEFPTYEISEEIEATKNDKTLPVREDNAVIPGQVTVDQATSLEWVHNRDCDYYHNECDGALAVLHHDGKTIKSDCNTCGMLITSTLATVVVQGD